MTYELKVFLKWPKPEDPLETQSKLDMKLKDRRKEEIIKALKVVIETLEKTG